MSITTFGELKAAVAARAVRTDLDALIPDFVRAAHHVIAARLTLCAELALNAPRVALPADARIVVSLWADGYPAAPLTLASEAQMQGLGAGAPLYFRVDGGDLVLGPAPAAAAAGRVLYKPTRTAFASDDDSSTVLQRYPSLYLYGTLAELFGHLRDGGERDRYLNLFLSGIEAANAAELEDLTAAASLRPLAQGVI